METQKRKPIEITVDFSGLRESITDSFNEAIRHYNNILQDIQNKPKEVIISEIEHLEYHLSILRADLIWLNSIEPAIENHLEIPESNEDRDI